MVKSFLLVYTFRPVTGGGCGGVRGGGAWGWSGCLGLCLGRCCGVVDDDVDDDDDAETGDEGGYDGALDGRLDSVDGENNIDDAVNDTEGDMDKGSLRVVAGVVEFEDNREGAEAVIENGSSVLPEPFARKCTNPSFGNEDDVDVTSSGDRSDCDISLSDAVTLKLLFLPVATLLTILGAPPTFTLALPGGFPFTTAFATACCLTPTPTSLTNDPTLPFALIKFRSTLRTSGFSVSSDTFPSRPRAIPGAGGNARS